MSRSRRGSITSNKNEVFVLQLNILWAISAVGSASHRHCGGHVFESRIAHHKGVETKVSTPLFFNKLPYKELLYISSTASFVASVGAIPNKPLKDGVVNARSTSFLISASTKPSSFNLEGTPTDFNQL